MRVLSAPGEGAEGTAGGVEGLGLVDDDVKTRARGGKQGARGERFMMASVV